MIRVLAVSVLTVFLFGCSEGGPEPPKAGTPGFYWNLALENYGKGDFDKTLDQLAKVTNSENEFAPRARAWRLALLAGMAKGYQDLAESFETGSNANKTSPTPLRRQMGTYRSMASQLGTQLAEDLGKFTKTQTDAEIPLGFPLPGGSTTRPALLESAAAGKLPGPNELENGQRDVIRRAVMLAACSVAGAPNDAPKAREILKDGSAKVSRDVFMKGLADPLFDLAGLFGKKKLGMPDRQKVLLTLAGDALKTSEDKESIELKKKIEADLKPLKGL